MALAGGVTIELPHGRGYLYQEGEILSADGHCRAFDRRAKGTVFGSGAGVVVLRRLEDALEDGDTVYAVIKGSAVNNDGAPQGRLPRAQRRRTGRGRGRGAPRRRRAGRHRHLRRVPRHRDARRRSDRGGRADPGLPRLHRPHALLRASARSRPTSATSTPRRVSRASSRSWSAAAPRRWPPSLHFGEPNPRVDFASSAVLRGRPGRARGRGRPAPGRRQLARRRRHERPRRPRGGAAAAAAGALARLRRCSCSRRGRRPRSSGPRPASRTGSTADPSLDLADVAFTLAAGRRRFAERRAVVCASREDAVEALRSPREAARRHERPLGNEGRLPVPGRRRAVPRHGAGPLPIGAGLPRAGGRVPGAPPDARGPRPAAAHVPRRGRRGRGRRPSSSAPPWRCPRCSRSSWPSAELLRSWGLTPVSMIGHSLGEYVAAYLAGVFSLADALGVVTCRGRLFETLPEGAMLSVPLPEAEVAADLPPGLSFAAINGPGLCLVSGEVGLIAGLEARLAARGVEAKRLAIAVAAHSPMLEPILGPFERYLRSLRLAEPSLPFVSNVTGTWIRPEEARDPAYWVRHLRQPVRFADGLQALVAEGSPALLEVGPGRTLTSLAALAPGGGRREIRHPGAAAPAGPHQRSRGRARGHGSAVDRGRRCRLAGLLRAGTPPGEPAGLLVRPRAALDRAGRRLLPPAGEVDGPREEPGSLRLDLPAGVAAERDTRRRAMPARNVLVFEDEAGLGRELALELRAAGHAVDLVRPGDAFGRDPDGAFRLRPDSREDHAALLRELGTAGRTPSQIVHLWGVGERRRPRRGARAVLLPPRAPRPGAARRGARGPRRDRGSDERRRGRGTRRSPRFPAKALVQGPARVLPRELPFVSCRTVDLPPSLVPRRPSRGSSPPSWRRRRTRAASPSATASGWSRPTSAGLSRRPPGRGASGASCWSPAGSAAWPSPSPSASRARRRPASSSSGARGSTRATPTTPGAGPSVRSRRREARSSSSRETSPTRPPCGAPSRRARRALARSTPPSTPPA